MSAARLSPQARGDLLRATRWIATDNPAAAEALREAVGKAVSQIGTHRNCGVARPEIIGAPYRFVTLTGFPYLLVYNADFEPPLVVRVVHGARDLQDVTRRI